MPTHLVPTNGQAEAKGRLIRRSPILTAALAPIAALSLVTPAAGSAQPLDCQNGEWWDPRARSSWVADAGRWHARFGDSSDAMCGISFGYRYALTLGSWLSITGA